MSILRQLKMDIVFIEIMSLIESCDLGDPADLGIMDGCEDLSDEFDINVEAVNLAYYRFGQVDIDVSEFVELELE